MAKATTPIIIIGAGRSGTNMLRDLLTALPGVGSWPCDEINYIWRHGNARYPSDEFPPDFATPHVAAFIQRQFEKLFAHNDFSHGVEKTCANSLRVSFVSRVFPKARFVSIVRDGRDVAVSAAERWKAPLDIPYLAKKARYIPRSDLPYYASKYLWSRLYRLVSREKRVSVWGPRFSGMKEVFSQHSLPVASAIQWKRCVESSEQQLGNIDPGQVFRLRYEDFVANPADCMQQLLAFLEIEASQSEIHSILGGVSNKSVGRWKTILDEQTHTAIMEQIAPVLERFSYHE